MKTIDHTDKKIIGIYHKNCKDGTTAAAILLQQFPEINLFPLGYGYEREDFEEILKEITEDTIVYVTDFSPLEEDLLMIAKKAHHLFILDHHITVEERLKNVANTYDNVDYTFDNERSGASLTWLHFHDEVSMPEIVQLVEYSDTGNWHKDERTKFSSAYLTPIVNNPGAVVDVLTMPIEEILEKAIVTRTFIDFLIERFMTKTEPITLRIDNHPVVAYNATHGVQTIISSIGRELSTKHHATVVMFRITGENVRLSFRGIDGASPSGSELAESLGGGGHRNSSGASVTLKEFMDMIVFPD